MGSWWVCSRFAVALVVVGGLSACPRATQPDRDRPDAPFAEGRISFYGEWFRGKPTANGEKFDPDGLTAAHRRLRFGTCLVVENLENGRKVRVRVNDRGPYVEGRILDVSEGAARKLGMVERGVVRARLWRCDQAR